MSWKALTALTSPGGRRGSLAVLFLHRVLAQPDPLLPDEPTPGPFEDMLRRIRSQYTLLPLSEALRRLDQLDLPPAAACLTFDDGYRDNLEIAAPILRRLGAPATFFIATDFMAGGLMWNDRIIESIRLAPGPLLRLPQFGIDGIALDDSASRRAAVVQLLRAFKHLPGADRDRAVAAVEAACGSPRLPSLMMSAQQVRSLHEQGFEIGAHTCSHPILTQLSDADAEREIRGSRDQLQALLGTEIPLFAYPNGREGQDFDARHCALARRAGFAAAFTTDDGVSGPSTDRWRMPRFTPWDRRPLHFRAQLLRNQLNKRVHTLP